MRGNDLRRLGIPVGLVLLAGVVRFATLRQSYEFDEAVTVTLLRMHSGAMLAAIPGSESTPPLYYVLAWGWTHLFGTGEAGLRSLSALIGTLLVAVLFVLTARFFSRRAAIVVALLAAVNPFLVWYSQEARAYALLALLTTVSLGLFAQALARPSRRVLTGWGVVSAAALATHYFAVFPVGIEALWLLARGKRGRMPPTWPSCSTPALAAVAGVAACGVALAPLAVHQQSRAACAPLISSSGSLAVRVAEIPKQFAVGYSGPAEPALGAIGVALALAALWLWWAHSAPGERARQLPFAAIGALSIALPVLLALAGIDLVIARNAIVAWAPLAALVAAGAAARRRRPAGAVLAAGLCLLCAGVLVTVLVNPAYQRDDWRGAARAIGTASVARALVLNDSAATPALGSKPPVALSIYLPSVEQVPRQGVVVAELDLVALSSHSRLSGLRAPRPTVPLTLPGAWHEIDHTYARTFTAIRLRLDRPALVRQGPVAGLTGRPGQLLVVAPR